jgi:hypothetical protein
MPTFVDALYCMYSCLDHVSQIMYDLSDGGQRARTRTVITLGYWHSYKQANFLVYKAFAKSFMAGCFPSLFPNIPFFPKPRHLSSIVTLLTYIRLAYPTFRDALATALSGDVGAAQRKHLENLQALCEFYIPVVIYFPLVISLLEMESQKTFSCAAVPYLVLSYVCHVNLLHTTRHYHTLLLCFRSLH